MKVTFYISIFLFLSSCTLFRLLNTSSEQNEEKLEIEAFLKKHKYKFDYSFENYDSTAYLLRNPKYRINGDSVKYSYIQLRIYHPNGDLYSGYSQCMGDFNAKKIIDSMPPKRNLNPYLNANLKFENELDLLNLDVETKNKVISSSKKFDYTFVVYYTIWTNYFSKHVLKEVSKIKKSYPSKICVILVNTAKNKK